MLRSACDLGAIAFSLPADSEAFARVVRLTRDASGLWLTPGMDFTASELAECNFVQVACTRTVRETDKDYARNKAVLDRSPEVVTGPDTRIRLLEGITLSRLALKPNEVAHLDEWAEEYVLGQGVTQSFRDDGLDGFETRPVLDGRTGDPYGIYHQLYTRSILPPALLDASTFELPISTPTDRSYRQMGFLTYEPRALAEAAHFNRTAEPWAGTAIPSWVVRRGVAESFRRHKLKGWRFKPVLEANGPAYADYLEQWRRLYGLMSANPRNFF